MSDYKKHLYAIMYPNQALIASQLEPNEFARHYTVGSSRYYSGKLIFVEIDINFRNPYFQIDRILEQTKTHEDGSPKHTKFIAAYRTLEHLDFNAMLDLYAVNSNGVALKIQKAPYTAINEPGLIRIYQEMNPVTFLVASTYDQREFGRILTQPDYPKGCPKLMFTQIELPIEHFLKQIDENPFMAPPIPGVHPLKLKSTITALKKKPEKAFKSISLASLLRDIPMIRLKHGFWFTSQDQMLFYPLPGIDELQQNHYDWLKSCLN